MYYCNLEFHCQYFFAKVKALLCHLWLDKNTQTLLFYVT